MLSQLENGDELPSRFLERSRLGRPLPCAIRLRTQRSDHMAVNQADSNGAHSNVAIHVAGVWSMPRYYEPDLTVDPNSPFVRDAANKLVRRAYWMDMNDRTLVMVMTQGIGANLTNDEKRAHLIDLNAELHGDRVAGLEADVTNVPS